MRSFSFDFFYLANPQSFCFFHFVRLTEKPKITLRHALGIPHSFSVFPSISNPFISLYFRPFQAISALRFASALANVNEDKKEKKRKSRILVLTNAISSKVQRLKSWLSLYPLLRFLVEYLCNLKLHRR